MKVTYEKRIILVDFSTEIPIPANARKTERGKQWRRQCQTLTETQPINAAEGAIETISLLFDEPIICGVRDAKPTQLRMKIPEDGAFGVEDLVELLVATIT